MSYIGGGASSGSSGSSASVTSSAAPPISPSLGDIWHDSNDSVTYLRIDAGGDNHIWVDISSGGGANIDNIRPGMSSGPTLPPSPLLGDKHFITTDGKVYLYLNDGSSNVWVSI